MAGRRLLPITRRGGRAVESAINPWVAEVINDSGWCTAKAERTRTVSGKHGKRPDIIVRPKGTGSVNQAVIIELETDRSNLEREVGDRLEVTLEEGNITPSAIVGVLFPDELAHADDADDFRTKFGSSELEYFVHDRTNRFPTNGYLRGNITDVITATRLSIVSRNVEDEYTEIIQKQINSIANTLVDADNGVKSEIISLLGYNKSTDTLYGMSDRQAMSMAALMLLNGSIFYEELSSHLDEIKTLTSIGSLTNKPTKYDIMNGMESVLDINYGPVFEITRDLFNVIPERSASVIIDVIIQTVSVVMSLGMQNSGDVYGALYQNDLIERKKSASFYTRPEAATLLAELVLPPISDKIWNDKSRIEKLRIADFACGTGMLLTAAYNHIIHCHANDENIAKMHPTVMADVLWGFDIMPTATHLTVSNLAVLYPANIFKEARIYQMPIGTPMPVKTRPRKPVRSLGSLDLIRDVDSEISEDSISLEIEALSGDVGKRHGGQGGQNLTSVRLRSESFDFVLMNPPFVKATNHGSGRTDPVPPFAVFGIPPDIQSDMGKTNANLFCETGSHGHAGLASYFIAITHRKLKPGGVMGFILPATMTSGSAWSDIREVLNQWYDDITVVRLRRSAGTDELTFSAGTGMEEVVLIARKRTTKWPEGQFPRIKFVLLNKLPTSRLGGLEVAKIIRKTPANRIEHCMGGTSLVLGDTHVGDMLDCTVEDGRWMLTRTSNIFLLQTAYSLINGGLGIEMTTIGEISYMGKHHLDIIGTKHDGTPQGPFIKIRYGRRQRYQCLWGNDAKTQRIMVVPPDYSLEKKQDATKEQVNNVWDTRTHTHINLYVRYTSQRLIAAYTEMETVGGSAWPNVRLNDSNHEKAFMVWFNSIFGILTYWFVSNSQQTERGLMTLTSCRQMPVPDFASMDEHIITQLDGVFDDLCKKEMKPINMVDSDKVRQEIDRRVSDILGLSVDNLEQIYDWLVHEKHLGRKDLEG